MAGVQGSFRAGRFPLLPVRQPCTPATLLAQCAGWFLQSEKMRWIMASESVSIADNIECEEGADIGIAGLITILNRRNYDEASCSDTGKLSNAELRTVTNQASNLQAALLNGLRTVGDLASSFDPQASNFDHLGVGWLVKHLTETLEVVLEIDASACLQLAERGYNSIGQPIRQHADRGLQS